MGGGRLHPPLCIHPVPKIAGCLLKGLCILETSRRKFRVISHSTWRHILCLSAHRVLPWAYLWSLEPLRFSGETETKGFVPFPGSTCSDIKPVLSLSTLFQFFWVGKQTNKTTQNKTKTNKRHPTTKMLQPPKPKQKKPKRNTHKTNQTKNHQTTRWWFFLDGDLWRHKI